MPDRPSGREGWVRGILLRTGLLSAVVYSALAFAFPLAGNWHRVLEWRELTGSSVILFLAVAAGGLALFGLYWRAWIACREAASQGNHRLILAFSLLFAVILVGMYPVSSSDVYTYFLYGRILAFHHENPFVAEVGRLAGDSLNAYITPWVDSPSPYGPVWTLASSLANWLVGDRVFWGLLFFKALAAGCLFLAVLLVDRLLERAMPLGRDAGLLLFAWSPLLLFESVGNGHNDVVPLAVTLWALWLVLEHRAVIASAAVFVLAVLLKVSALLLAPIYVLIILELAKRDGRNVSTRRLLVGGGLGLLAALASYVPFGGLSRASQGVLEQGGLFTVSLPALARWTLQQVGFTPERWLLVGVLGTLFLLIYAWSLWKASRDWPSLATVGCGAYFMFLVLVWPQFHPWYLVWPLALAPFAREATLAARLVLFSALAVLGFSFGHAWPLREVGWQGDAPALGALAIFLPPLMLPSAWIGRILRPRDHLRLRAA